MPFNGSGVYTRVYNWVTDKNNSIYVTASRMDTEDTGFATGLSTCLLKDGTQNPTANLPMSGFIHTGVGNASARNHYATVGGIQDSLYNWVAGGGTADAITATYSPAVTALVDGMALDFRATAANATTTPTFSPNGITAHTITKNGGSALAANDIAGNLAEGKLRYNLANTRWELLNPKVSTSIPADTIGITQISRNSAQFDKTSDTALANVTGLSVNVISGSVYKFKAHILSNASTGNGGCKVAIGGTATRTRMDASSFGANGTGFSSLGQNLNINVGDTLFTNAAASTQIIIDVEGTMTCSGSGTLTFQYAQGSSSITTSSVLIGSTFEVTRIS